MRDTCEKGFIGWKMNIYAFREVKDFDKINFQNRKNEDEEWGFSITEFLGKEACEEGFMGL